MLGPVEASVVLLKVIRFSNAADLVTVNVTVTNSSTASVNVTCPNVLVLPPLLDEVTVTVLSVYPDPPPPAP